jgi:hypothetical protein
MNIPETPIAVGFTAEIYTWQAGQVPKLYNLGASRSTVEYEANLTRMVHATGLPVPAAGEVVEIDGRFGLELERVDRISIQEAFIQKPWTFPYYARQLVELKTDMHQCRVPELPSLGERLIGKFKRAEKLPENVRQAALKP